MTLVFLFVWQLDDRDSLVESLVRSTQTGHRNDDVGRSFRWQTHKSNGKPRSHLLCRLFLCVHGYYRNPGSWDVATSRLAH